MFKEGQVVAFLLLRTAISVHLSFSLMLFTVKLMARFAVWPCILITEKRAEGKRFSLILSAGNKTFFIPLVFVNVIVYE